MELTKEQIANSKQCIPKYNKDLKYKYFESNNNEIIIYKDEFKVSITKDMFNTLFETINGKI